MTLCVTEATQRVRRCHHHYHHHHHYCGRDRLRVLLVVVLVVLVVLLLVLLLVLLVVVLAMADGRFDHAVGLAAMALRWWP